MYALLVRGVGAGGVGAGGVGAGGVGAGGGCAGLLGCTELGRSGAEGTASCRRPICCFSFWMDEYFSPFDITTIFHSSCRLFLILLASSASRFARNVTSKPCTTVSVQSRLPFDMRSSSKITSFSVALRSRTSLATLSALGTASWGTACEEGTGEAGAVVEAGVSPIGRMPPKRRVALAHR